MSSYLTRENIREAIVNILKEKIVINHDFSDEKLFGQELTGGALRLRAREMLRLFFEVENEFNTRIPEEKIIEGKFNTINDITEIVFQLIL